MNTPDSGGAKITVAETPPHTCQHHRWNHTAQRPPESACALSKRRFGCPFRDAAKCPDYKAKGGGK